MELGGVEGIQLIKSPGSSMKHPRLALPLHLLLMSSESKLTSITAQALL